VEFSIYNPIPKTSAIKLRGVIHTRKNQSFYIYAFKNPDKKKELLLLFIAL
jgi:hypothetical protein